MKSLRLVLSKSYDPWFNLALEELLYDTIPENTVILYLWQNQNTVVIGKSQNAWKECRVSELEADGGKLARRPSGGGAVFHDLGNLCYTFLASSGLYDLEKQLSVILAAVGEQGIEARFTEKRYYDMRRQKIFRECIPLFQRERADARHTASGYRSRENRSLSSGVQGQDAGEGNRFGTRARHKSD